MFSFCSLYISSSYRASWILKPAATAASHLEQDGCASGFDLRYSVPVPSCHTLAPMGKDAVLVVQGKTSLHEVSLHARLRHDPQTNLLSHLGATFHNCFHLHVQWLRHLLSECTACRQLYSCGILWGRINTIGTSISRVHLFRTSDILLVCKYLRFPLSNVPVQVGEWISETGRRQEWGGEAGHPLQHETAGDC